MKREGRMSRTSRRIGNGGGFFLAVILASAGLGLLLGGCGEQDLYNPPTSPYRIIGRLPLPSVNEDVAVLGNHAYVAGGQAGLHVVDLTTPAAPRLVRSINTVKYAEAVECAATPTANGVAHIAFVVEGTEGITTYNIDRPDSVWSYQQGTTAVDGNGIFVELPATASSTYSVFLAETWKGIRIFDSDPRFPGVLRYNGVFAGTKGYARSIAVRDGWAYVADDEMGLTVLDVRTRIGGAVDTTSSCDTPGNARGIKLQGDYAYIADGKSGLMVMRIHGPDRPELAAQLLLAGDCRSIEVREGYAFLAAQDGGIHIVDIRNPASPQLAGTIVTTYATGVALTDDGLLVVSDRTDGLYVLAGPGGFHDLAAPAPVPDLSAEPVSSSTILLRWTASGDDGFRGVAASYEVRRSAEPITEANWGDATLIPDAPAPASGGTQETFEASGLELETTYHFALKVIDDAGNISAISNDASATTYAGNVPPQLLSPTITPLASTPGSTFTFEVTYRDPDGDAPTVHSLLLDGEPIEMAGQGSTYSTGVVFRAERVLPAGLYAHVFSFDDGNGHVVETPEIGGPFVGEPLTVGSPANERFRDADEGERTVALAWESWVDTVEVTQASFESVLGAARNVSRFRGANLPVESVTWYDAVEYCNERSRAEGLELCYDLAGDATTCDFTKNGYRLPTEAEWEQAARSGSVTAFPNGDITVETCFAPDTTQAVDPNLDAIGWYCGNAGPGTHEVAGKQPNAGGHYDMAGNVWEWCWDWYAAQPPPGVPTGPETGYQRTIRGGSWYAFSRDCRSAARSPYFPNSRDDVVGFRVARTIR